MASAATSASTQSLTSLLRQATLDDHDEVLKAANAALKKSKTDIDAQHVKVVALLRLDRYEDALRVLQEGGDTLRHRAQLENAYALYKVGDFEEAAQVAEKIGGSRGMHHVEAQTAYRLENFAKAAEIYKQLAGRDAEAQQEENDLRINDSATSAQLEWAGQGHLVQNKKPTRDDLEAFETAYNAACGSIARGELAQGAILLKRARDLCNESEDLSDEEKRAELLPITVQQVYVLSRLQKVEEAAELCSEISLADIPELATRHIAQNNLIASSTQSSNPYLAHRLFHSTPAMPKTAQPFDVQSSILRRNAYALDLLSLKYSGLAKSTSEYLQEQPSPTVSASVNTISVVNAAAHARNQLGKAAIKEMLPQLEKRPKDVGLLLTIIQLYMLTNNHGSAVSLLDTFLGRLQQSSAPADQDVRFAPGLVALIVSLYTSQGRKSQIKSELAKAASYWRHKSKPSSSLLLAAGRSLLESTKPEDHTAASQVFETLRKEDPNNRLAIAGYIASNAATSPDKIESELDKLTPIARLTAGVDVAALVRAGVAQPRSSTATGSKKRSAEDAVKPSKKRVRKSRVPKNVDAGKAPDPERWLPLRDRSTYRPRGKKGKQKAAALTQGGMSGPGGSEERLPLAGGAGVVKVEKAGGGAGAKNKKKGKGGKR